MTDPRSYRGRDLRSDLKRSLDIIFYCQLSILYYQDLSLARFLLRSFVHYIYLSPKSDVLPLLFPGHRPHLGSIISINALCAITHCFEPPSAGEADRWYLNGSLIIDFVGSRPAKRWRLISLDLLCVVIQCLMLCLVNIEFRNDNSDHEQGFDSQSQDIIAEEAGVRSDNHRPLDDSDNITDAEDLQDAGSDHVDGMIDEPIIAVFNISTILKAQSGLKPRSTGLGDSFRQSFAQALTHRLENG